MNHFDYVDGQLTCEQVAVADIADEVGTPFYLYSKATLEHHFKVFNNAFNGVPNVTAFAVKACSNLAVLALLAKQGAGADIVSGGELYRALKAGVPAEKIVFSGVGKTGTEIAEALEAGIYAFQAESFAELELISQVAVAMETVAHVALRVNPDVDPKTHPYISTGLKENKFGFPAEGVVEVFKAADALPGIRVVGLHQHIGSQITEIPPFVESVERAAALIGKLREAGLSIDYLNIGGGIGIPYDEVIPPSPAEIAAAIMPIIKGLNVSLHTEPGRGIAGNAGIFVTKVLRVKDAGEKTFVIVDGAMNDLMRPSLYNAYHRVQSINQNNAAADAVVDVVGPVCESGDFLAKDRTMPRPQGDDLLALMSAGAYGFTMASTYNSRPKVAEVLVDGDRFHIIRQRESYDDLVRGEFIPTDITTDTATEAG